MKKKSG